MKALGGVTALNLSWKKYNANQNALSCGNSAPRLAGHNHNAAMAALLQRYVATAE